MEYTEEMHAASIAHAHKQLDANLQKITSSQTLQATLLPKEKRWLDEQREQIETSTLSKERTFIQRASAALVGKTLTEIHDAGYTYAAIARATGISPERVRNIVTKWERTMHTRQYRMEHSGNYALQPWEEQTQQTKETK